MKRKKHNLSKKTLQTFHFYVLFASILSLFLGAFLGFSVAQTGSSHTAGEIYGGRFGSGDFQLDRLGVGAAVSSPATLLVAGETYINNGWLRVGGDKGIYFQDRGGGLHMKDSVTISVLGDKDISTGGTIYGGKLGLGTSTIGPTLILDVKGHARVSGALFVGGEALLWGYRGASTCNLFCSPPAFCIAAWKYIGRTQVKTTCADSAVERCLCVS